MLLAALQHDGDLLGGHGQHGQLDAVELVEAAPGAGLGEALVDAAEAPEVHLVGAVEDDDVLAEAAAHVLVVIVKKKTIKKTIKKKLKNKKLKN